MPSKVEPFFRFLVTHTMGALACFLSISSLSTLSGPVRILPLLVLFAGLFLAWRYRYWTQSTRDGIITTLCAPIGVIVSYCCCLRSAHASGLTLPESGTSLYLILFAWSIGVMFSSGRDEYWKALTWTLVILMAICPLAFFFLKSGEL